MSFLLFVVAGNNLLVAAVSINPTKKI